MIAKSDGKDTLKILNVKIYLVDGSFVDFNITTAKEENGIKDLGSWKVDFFRRLQRELFITVYVKDREEIISVHNIVKVVFKDVED